MRKVWVPISQVLSMQWLLLHFPVLWEVDGKTHAFPIWWNSLIFPANSNKTELKRDARDDDTIQKAIALVSDDNK